MRNLWELSDDELRQVYRNNPSVRKKVQQFADQETLYDIDILCHTLMMSAYDICFAYDENNRVYVLYFHIWHEKDVEEWRNENNIPEDIEGYLNAMFQPDDKFEDMFVDSVDEILDGAEDIFVDENYILYLQFT